MRLWHQSLIERLPRQQLLGQHRECCALRGNGWKKKHKTINYVFRHPLVKLFDYHHHVMIEMMNRGYNVTKDWLDITYRGKKCPKWKSDPVILNGTQECYISNWDDIIYPEHNEEYLKECINNLMKKGVTCRFYNNLQK